MGRRKQAEVEATTIHGQPVRSEAEREVHDSVNHLPHYTQGGVECIDAIRAALGREGFIAFLRGQVIKYEWRLGLKDDALEDARKGGWYHGKLIEVLSESDEP